MLRIVVADLQFYFQYNNFRVILTKNVAVTWIHFHHKS